MNKPLIEKDIFDALCDAMGAEFVGELVSTFLTDAPNIIGDLKTAAAAGDADGYRRAAHSIKSNAQIFGAAALADQARDLELSGPPNGDGAVAQLQTTFDETAAALRGLLDE